MSVGGQLWDMVYGALKADSAVMSLVDDIYDKVPEEAWKAPRLAFISRGPFFGVPDDADCISGQEVTIQIDVWSRRPNRWSCDDIVDAVRRVFHRASFDLPQGALCDVRVTLWRVIDDPDPLTTHGVVQITATVEEEDM